MRERFAQRNLFFQHICRPSSIGREIARNHGFIARSLPQPVKEDIQKKHVKNGVSLVVVNSSGIKYLEIEKHSLSIGRDASCDIRLTNIYASKRHATLDIVNGEVIVSAEGLDKELYVIAMPKGNDNDPHLFDRGLVNVSEYINPGDAIVAGLALIVITHIDGMPFADGVSGEKMLRFIKENEARIICGGTWEPTEPLIREKMMIRHC